MDKKLINKFFDINKIPPKEGLLIFPISMSRINNTQNGSRYFDVINEFTKKLTRGVVGCAFLYTDNLYAKYNQLPSIKKDRYLEMMISHKNEFLKNLRNKSTFVESAFSFITWSQIILEINNFSSELKKIKEFYKNDKDFRKYVKEDINMAGRKVTNNHVYFILEETLIAYLMIKDEIKIANDFVNGRDKWRLICYPGKPNKSMIYFVQKNIKKLETGNIYDACQYDLDEKKLYRFDNIDLETLKF